MPAGQTLSWQERTSSPLHRCSAAAAQLSRPAPQQHVCTCAMGLTAKAVCSTIPWLCRPTLPAPVRHPAINEQPGHKLARLPVGTLPACAASHGRSRSSWVETWQPHSRLNYSRRLAGAHMRGGDGITNLQACCGVPLSRSLRNAMITGLTRESLCCAVLLNCILRKFAPCHRGQQTSFGPQ